MLSDNDIKKVTNGGGITISPFSSAALRPSGYVFHLGHDLLIPEKGGIADVKNRIIPKYTPSTLSEANPYRLEPGGFILGATLEHVSLSNEFSLLIEGRSTLARLGMTVVQTATLVYPGHSDRGVTLELANHGPHTILLYPEMKIARGMFFRLETPADSHYDTSGKYRNQKSAGIPVFDQELRVITDE